MLLGPVTVYQLFINEWERVPVDSPLSAIHRDIFLWHWRSKVFSPVAKMKRLLVHKGCHEMLMKIKLNKVS
jgi:hypothetical protein